MFHRWPSKIQTPNLHRAQPHFSFFSILVSSFFCLFLLFVFHAVALFSLSSPPFFYLSFLFLPLRSLPHFISPPSPFLLLFFFLRSLCLLKVLNKQTSSGWLASPIYNSSQSNYSEDVCQTHEVHLSASYAEREGKKKQCFTITAWTLHTENIAGRFQIMFMAFLLRGERKHNVEIIMGRILWDQRCEHE